MSKSEAARGTAESVPYRADIEGLRAIAVLLVVLCHASVAWCPGGFVGVDVFFVLSGYLITALLLAELNRTAGLDFIAFYARRVRRLMPALLLVLAATLLVGLCVQAPQELDSTARAARATALYLSNVFFDHNAADYFAPNIQTNPLLHTWSLGVEEQFYLFWPALILLGVRGRRGIALPLTLGAVTAVSLGFCLWSTFHMPTVAFYELPARAWEFALGGLLAAVRGPAWSRVAWTVIGWTGLGAILSAALLIRDGSQFPGWLAAIPAAGTAATLAAGQAVPGGGIAAVLSAKPLQYLGRRSYSWYLWHWPFIVFSTVIVPSISVPGKVLVATASLGAAALTYRWVETPVRHNRALISRPRRSVRIALASAALAAAAAWGVVLVANSLAVMPRMAPITAAMADIAAMPRSECVSLGSSTEAVTCSFGEEQSPVVVLFGDSHAIEWFDALLVAARSEHWRLVTVVKSGCAASELEGATVAQTATCREWRAKALAAIVRLHPSRVFVASFSEWFGHPANRRADPGLEKLTSGIRATLTQLSDAGLEVVLLRDSPFPPFNVPLCLQRAALHPWVQVSSCEFDREAGLSGAVLDAQHRAAAGLRGVEVLDLTDAICPGARCPAVVGGVIVYRDENHMTGHFARTLAPLLVARLAALEPAHSDKSATH